MNDRRDAGLTLVEILVGLAILGVVIFVVLPAAFEFVVASRSHAGSQTLSNMKQLHLATQQMVLDGETNGNASLGWPGDTGGTFTNWVNQLVPAYLGTNDFCKLLSAPGVTLRPWTLPAKMSEGALIVYAVSSNSPPETVLFSTANFTNSPTGGAPLLKSAKPYGKRGFIVFRKTGDGAMLSGSRVGKTNEIGAYAPPVK